MLPPPGQTVPVWMPEVNFLPAKPEGHGQGGPAGSWGGGTQTAGREGGLGGEEGGAVSQGRTSDGLALEAGRGGEGEWRGREEGGRYTH